MEKALEKSKGKDTDKIFKDLKHWVLSLKPYSGSSYHSLFKARALFNAVLLERRVDTLTSHEAYTAWSYCQEVIETYSTTRGNYYRWKALKKLFMKRESYMRKEDMLRPFSKNDVVECKSYGEYYVVVGKQHPYVICKKAKKSRTSIAILPRELRVVGKTT